MKTGINTFKRTIVVLAVLFCTALCSQATSITWSVGAISGSDGVESDVSTVGTLVEAVNFGATAPATTLNGVTFEAFTASGSNFTTDNLSTLVDSSSDNATFYTDPNTSYNALLQSLIFDTTTPEAAYTLTGLTIGRDYEVQLFIADDRGAASNFDYLDVDGNGPDLNGTSTTYYGGGPRPARVFTGTFTADALTQDFTALRRNIDDSADGTALSAYQLRNVSVPEPSILGLFGLGAVLLNTIRRRMNAD